MSVVVDYTGDGNSVYFSALGNPAYPVVRGTVLDRADDAFSQFESLADVASSLSRTARARVDDLVSFTPGFGTVDYEPPEYDSALPSVLDALASFVPEYSTDAPDVPYQPYNPDGFSIPDYTGSDLSAVITASQQLSVPPPQDFSSVFDGLNKPGEIASALPAKDVPLSSAGMYNTYSPNSTAPAQPVYPSVTKPVLNAVPFPQVDLFTPEALVIDQDTLSAIDALIARIEGEVSGGFGGLVDAAPDLDNYEALIPEVFSAYATLLPTAEEAGPLQTALTYAAESGADELFKLRRTAPPGFLHADGFTKMYARLDQDVQATADAIAAKTYYAVTRAGIKLGAAAYKLLSTIEVSIYDLRYELAKASAVAQLEVAKATVLLFNAKAARASVYAANYTAEAAVARGIQGVVDGEVTQAKLLGDLASANARAYAADIGSQRVLATDFAARVSAEVAKTGAYSDTVSAVAATIATDRATVMEATKAALDYGAEVETLRTHLGAYKAEVDAKIARNNALASEKRLQGAEWSGAVAAIETDLATALAKTSTVSASARTDAARLELDSLAYAPSRAEYIQFETELRTLVAAYEQEAAKTEAAQIGRAEEYSLISEYVNAASQAASRAASLTQTTNEQVGRAMASLYEAAGRAGKTLAVGSMSPFRADASLAASDRLSASVDYSVDLRASGRKQFSQSTDNTKRISV